MPKQQTVLQENCILELFRLDDATSYRVGYVWIRQLALLLRNASMASSKGGSINAQTAKTAKAKAKAKAAKGRAKRDKAAKGKAGKEKMGKCEAEEEEAPRRKVKTKPLEELMSWQFVRSMYLWTRVVTSVPSLKPLAYPLFMVILGAVKSFGCTYVASVRAAKMPPQLMVRSRLTNLQCFPFVCHGLTCLNRLAAGLEVLVPLSSHLLTLGGLGYGSGMGRIWVGCEEPFCPTPAHATCKGNSWTLSTISWSRGRSSARRPRIQAGALLLMSANVVVWSVARKCQVSPANLQMAKKRRQVNESRPTWRLGCCVLCDIPCDRELAPKP